MYEAKVRFLPLSLSTSLPIANSRFSSVFLAPIGIESRDVDKVIKQEWCDRSSLFRSLQRMETNVRLLPPFPRCLADKGVMFRWDEWVPEERLNKYNEENIRKQKALIEQQRARDAAEREAQKLIEAENARRAAAGVVVAGAGGGGGALAGMTGGAGMPVGAAATVRREEGKRTVKRGREGEGVSRHALHLS